MRDMAMAAQAAIAATVATAPVAAISSRVRLSIPAAGAPGCAAAAARREGCCVGSSSIICSSGREVDNFGAWNTSSVGTGGGGGAGSGGLRRTRLSAAKQESDPSKPTFGWFKFGKNGMDSVGAGIYGSQKREDFDRDDVEQYFNYMGMLATEGTYDKMEALLSTGIQPVDILLLLAASEGDTPKIEELLRAGADYRVKDDQGRNALDRAQDDDTRELILSKSQVNV